MANDEAGEKTEEPTAKQYEKAQEEGNVAKSRELTSGVLLLVSILFLYFYFPFILEQSEVLFREIYQSLMFTVDKQSIRTILFFSLLVMGKMVLPMFVLLLVVTFLAEALQVGIHVSAKALEPKWNRINFFTALPNFFKGKRKLIELIKSLFKISVLSIVAIVTINDHMDTILRMTDAEFMDSQVFTGELLFELVFKISIVVVFLGILDFMYQKWQHKQDLKMTKQQIKEEYKQMEGDPLIKQRIRSAQRDMARKRMMEDVPTSDVVVTNPTHYAVALKYDPKAGGAPMVVAKGQRLMALRIRELATEHGVYIHEDPPLAQTLFKTLEIGDQIPENLYKAVAEILSIVYKAKNKSVN